MLPILESGGQAPHPTQHTPMAKAGMGHKRAGGALHYLSTKSSIKTGRNTLLYEAGNEKTKRK